MFLMLLIALTGACPAYLTHESAEEDRKEREVDREKKKIGKKEKMMKGIGEC